MKPKQVVVNSALFHVIGPFVTVARFTGFLPVSWEKSGNDILLKTSTGLWFYSYVLATILMSSNLAGLIADMNPSTSIRLHDGAGKYVTICDMGDIILGCFISMIATPLRIQYFWKALNNFHKFDRMLPVYAPGEERRFSLKFIWIFLGQIVLILLYDIIIWTQAVGVDTQLFFLRNTTFYITYFLIFVAGIPSWHLNRMIKDRLSTLNLKIKSSQIEEEEKLIISQAVFRKVKSVENEKKGFKMMAVDEEAVNNYMKLYDYLQESCEASNNFCSINVLLILFSCLLHLVVTPYFFLTLLTKAGDLKFILLDAFWIWLQMSRLFVIVEGCQGCISEHQNTVNLVYQLLATDLREEVKEHLRTFALQLSSKKLVFTSFSLMKIKRSLLTAVASAVGTFVVILFQFGSLGSDQHQQ